MKQIPIQNRDFFAQVDDEDYDLVSQYRWYAIDNRKKRTAYASRSLDRNGKRTSELMHRLILGAQPGQFVDHKDGDGLNNVRSNLRIATKMQNACNRKKPEFKNASSKYKGVTFSKRDQKWYAYIEVNKKRKFLGYHPTQEDCALAYDLAAQEFHGEYAYLNFPLGTNLTNR